MRARVAPVATFRRPCVLLEIAASMQSRLAFVAQATGLCRRLIVRLVYMIFGAVRMTSRLFHSATVGVCWEVLPGGVKWGVIWSSIRMLLPGRCAIRARVLDLVPADRWVTQCATDTGSLRPDAPAGSPSVLPA